MASAVAASPASSGAAASRREGARYDRATSRSAAASSSCPKARRVGTTIWSRRALSSSARSAALPALAASVPLAPRSTPRYGSNPMESRTNANAAIGSSLRASASFPTAQSRAGMAAACASASCSTPTRSMTAGSPGGRSGNVSPASTARPASGGRGCAAGVTRVSAGEGLGDDGDPWAAARGPPAPPAPPAANETTSRPTERR